MDNILFSFLFSLLLVGFDNKLFGTKSTKNYAFQNGGDPSHRNSLIKIKNS